jgi:hypothetical protein
MFAPSKFRTGLVLAMSLLFIAHGAFAKGPKKPPKGKGRTKIDITQTLGNPATSRFFGKFDVAAGVAQLPKIGSSSRNDDLQGTTVTMTLNGASFAGLAEQAGMVTSPFTAKLTANGGILNLQAYGIDLQTLFGIVPIDGTYNIIVSIVITAAWIDPTTLEVIEVVLSNQNVTFTTTVSLGAFKGRNY